MMNNFLAASFFLLVATQSFGVETVHNEKKCSLKKLVQSMEPGVEELVVGALKRKNIEIVPQSVKGSIVNILLEEQGETDTLPEFYGDYRYIVFNFQTKNGNKLRLQTGFAQPAPLLLKVFGSTAYDNEGAVQGLRCSSYVFLIEKETLNIVNSSTGKKILTGTFDKSFSPYDNADNQVFDERYLAAFESEYLEK